MEWEKSGKGSSRFTSGGFVSTKVGDVSSRASSCSMTKVVWMETPFSKR